MIDAIEEWRAVPHHPDYQVSAFGRAQSLKRSGPPRILKLQPDRAGYIRVGMDGVHVSIHQAVAEAWHGSCPEGLEVDHINRVRGDNRPQNLQYLTRQQNVARAKHVLAPQCINGHPFSGDNLLVVSTSRERRCRTCNRQWAVEFSARIAGTEIPDSLHGTANGYINYKCRCEPCKKANSEYRRKNRQAA